MFALIAASEGGEWVCSLVFVFVFFQIVPERKDSYNVLMVPEAARCGSLSSHSIGQEG